MRSLPSPASSAASDLRVRLLGGLAVDGIGPSALGSRKGRHVLALLALAAGRPVHVDTLLEAVWPGRQPARPAEDLGVLVSRLRGTLGAGAIVRTDAGYALEGAWVDLVEVEARVADAAAALERGQPGAARLAAEAALQLVRGPLLPELDEDGAVVVARHAAARAAAHARQVIARSAAAMGDHLSTAVAAEAALDHDPYDEVALCLLMEAHASAGRVASALAAYVRVRDRMVEDLGVTPGPATEALHDRLVLASGVDPAPIRPAAAADAGRPADRALVGRSAELAVLDGVLGEVAAGQGARSVHLGGAAGIGKTALLSTWFAGLPGRAVVLAGRGDDLGRDLPLQPVADALSSHLRALGSDGAAAVLGPDADVVADLLGLPGGTGGPGGGRVAADAGRGRVRLFAGLLAVVERCGGDGPVVLAVDDAHLADPLTSEWLGFARRRGQRVVVVSAGLTAPSQAPDTDLVLGPLDRADAATLTGLADGDRLASIHQRAGGNPLFLLALASGPPGGSDDQPLPASVRDAVRRQVAGLGGAAGTLAVAAVLGRGIDLDLLAELVDQPASVALAHLEAALAAGIVVERGAGLEFHHELVRAALADDLSAARRRLLHHDAARVLAARPAADPLKVAVHARHGGDVELAIEQYVAAGLEALGRFDTDASAAHLDAAVGLGGSEAAYAARARLRLSRSDLEGAAADATRGVEIGGGPGALEIAAWVAYYRRRYEDARVLAEAGAARAEDPSLLASCQAVAGRVRHAAGDLAGASSWLAAVAGAPPHVQGVAGVWLGFCQVHQGAMEEALGTLANPLIDADRLAHPWAGLHGRYAATMALAHLGRLGEALARCDDLDAAVDREGEVGARFRAPAANVRGWLLRHGGAPEAADEANRHALDLTVDQAGHPTGESVLEYHYVAQLDLADGRLLAGDPAGAAELAERLAPVDQWTGTMAWHQRHRLGLLRARLALADGDTDAAAGLAGAVLDDARARGAGRYEALAAAWLALAGGSDPDEVASVVERLATVASLEGWRLTASLGRRYQNDAWVAEAGRRAGALAAAAGPQAEPLRAAIAAVLG